MSEAKQSSLEEKISIILRKEDIKVPKIYDLRQGMFMDIAQKIKEKQPDVEVARTIKGYPASAVNLGQLHKIMLMLIKKYNVCDKEAMAIVLEMFVQRLKSVNITRHTADYGKNKEYHEEWFNVKFETKDDYNWYSYKFSVMIKVPEPRPLTKREMIKLRRTIKKSNERYTNWRLKNARSKS